MDIKHFEDKKDEKEVTHADAAIIATGMDVHDNFEAIVRSVDALELKQDKILSFISETFSDLGKKMLEVCTRKIEGKEDTGERWNNHMNRLVGFQSELETNKDFILSYERDAINFIWIEPGKFMMGSPSDEPNRRDNEEQHEVVLTQGFWLAETACTQALWQAVMGKNPSKFKGLNRPVENVSWDDCQEFIKRINAQMPGLNCCLPTEAQWEYACRAGTTTPFSFGQNITPQQVNYDGNFSYAGGEKGENRNQTVEVKFLPANPWGLYEMHGNVWEWCADWYGSYGDGRAEDPSGHAMGEVRVLRGGSWLGSARICRSAYRLGSLSVNRSGSIGFRLSRGQDSRAQEQDRK